MAEQNKSLLEVTITIATAITINTDFLNCAIEMVPEEGHPTFSHWEIMEESHVI